MATSAALALGLAATLWAGLPAAEVTSDCQLDVETGWASHVGPWSQADPWRYPWPDVLWARQNGLAPSGSITDETEIHDITRVVALHRVMHETSVLGRYVLIEHSGTGRQEWALVLDALAGHHAGPGALGWEPGVNYNGVIADLTPQQFARLDSTTWPTRGRIPVRILIFECSGGLGR